MMRNLDAHISIIVLIKDTLKIIKSFEKYEDDRI